MNLILSIALAIATWSDPLSVFAPTDHEPRPKTLDGQSADNLDHANDRPFTSTAADRRFRWRELF
jgi:hypothetical protein